MTRLPPPSRFSPEFSLLLTCCRPEADPSALARQRSLLAQIDPERLLTLVDRHRVAPVVCHHLLRLPHADLPPALAQGLSERHRVAVFDHFVLHRETVHLHHVLVAAGVDYVSLKGVTLGARYFGDAGLRTSRDIDVLVAPSAVETAIASLRSAGYVPKHDHGDLTPRQSRYLKSRHYDCSFLSSRTGTCVELHWRPTANPELLPSLVIGMDSDVIDYVALSDISVPLLRKEELLLYLCVHGTRHCWFRLKWLFDLPVVLESADWDWPAVLERAEANHCSRHLALGLALARQLCDWAAPDAIAEWLSQQRIEADVEIALKALLGPEEQTWGTLSAGVDWGRLRYHARHLTTWSGWSHGIKWIATSPNDWKLLPLPDALFPLYFPLRPALWAWRLMRQGGGRTG